jgi:hypothetical protein
MRHLQRLAGLCTLESPDVGSDDSPPESIETVLGVLRSGFRFYFRWIRAMSAKHRPAVRTLETVYRTYHLPSQVRKNMADKRRQFGLTVAEFMSQAISNELPHITLELEQVGLPTATSKQDRPARLPLSDELLAALKRASNKTGIPASRLLVACVSRGSRRKRKWRQC